MKLLIDCSYICHRAYHTLGDLSHEQKKVGVVYGFIKEIIKLAKKFETNELVFCWDSKQSYRSLVYPQYKANRRIGLTAEEMEALMDAYRQFDDIKDILLPMMGFVNNFRQTGYEGDDIIGWISSAIPGKYMIVSGDADLLQLLTDDVYIYNFNNVITPEIFSAGHFGISPKQYALVKAIAGCDGDNVKGIVGVGEKSAAKYIAGLHLGPAMMGKIESDDGKRITRTNLPVVTLPYMGPKPYKINALSEDEITPSKFKAMFGQYGFRSLLKEEEIAKWVGVFRME
jgi:DNA polymerase I